MDASSIGPAERRYAATVNSARHAGELATVHALRTHWLARQQAVDEVPHDGGRTPDELAEARAVVALHQAWP